MNKEEEMKFLELAVQLVRLRQALGYFVDDTRFDVAVGGNPREVKAMLSRAKQVYLDTAPPKKTESHDK